MKTSPRSSKAALPQVFGLAFALAVPSALALAGLPTLAGAQSLAVVGVRVFDGEEVIERATVLVEDGVIAVVGPDAPVPAGVETIDGAGRTLLPGFIDGHGHSQGDALRRAAVFGTTTVADMFTEAAWAAEQRAQQAAGEANDRADLFSSGTLATAPGGHGTQYGIPIPTLSTPEEADAWVADRIEEGSDYIKIVIEDGTVIDLETPTLDLPTVQALVQAARSRGKLAVAHATTVEAARTALAADVDGLVHIFGDEPPPEDFAPAAAEAGIFVVPTLTVLESLTTGASGAPLADDPHIGPVATSQERAQLASTYPRSAAEGYALQHAVGRRGRPPRPRACRSLRAPTTPTRERRPESACTGSSSCSLRPASRPRKRWPQPRRDPPTPSAWTTGDGSLPASGPTWCWWKGTRWRT